MILSFAFSNSTIDVNAFAAARQTRRFVDQFASPHRSSPRTARNDAAEQYPSLTQVRDAYAPSESAHDRAISGRLYHHLVKTARRSAKSRTSGTVSCGDNDDTFRYLEAVHLNHSIWFNVCSRSSHLVTCATLATYGVDFIDEDNARRRFLACSNMSRTRDAPTPTNISTKSVNRKSQKNGTFRFTSPQWLFASRGLPAPRPTIRTPFRILPPSFWKRLGSRRYSTKLSPLLLRFVTTRQTSKANVVLIFRQHTRLALTERHGALPPPPAFGTHEEDPDADHNSIGNQNEDRSQRGLALQVVPPNNPLTF